MPTRFSTLTAGLGAPLTVIAVVTAALFCAAIAGFGAGTTQLLMQVRPSAHKASTHRTQVSAIAAKLNALSHHLHHVTA